MNGRSHTKHENRMNNLNTSVLARILALLMGAARPQTSRKGRAADAITLQGVSMRNPLDGCALLGDFIKNRMKAAAGRHRGGGRNPQGGMGVSTPMINSSGKPFFIGKPMVAK